MPTCRGTIFLLNYDESFEENWCSSRSKEKKCARLALSCDSPISVDTRVGQTSKRNFRESNDDDRDRVVLNVFNNRTRA